jgi:hypothetical protein
LNRSGDAALHAVSETGDKAVSEALIHAGADVNKRNWYASVCVIVVDGVCGE